MRTRRSPRNQERLWKALGGPPVAPPPVVTPAPPQTVRTIVKAWLITRGFDGLVDTQGDCGCDYDDLMPCEGPQDRCVPGYRVVCPSDCGDHDWHISEEKP